MSQALVKAAIESGDHQRARRLLQPLLDDSPTAEAWYLASQLYEQQEHQLTCLRRALRLNPHHQEARRHYARLQREIAEPPDLADPRFDHLMPPLSALIDYPTLPEQPTLPTRKLGRKQRTTWTYIGWGSSILFSISLTYFVLTLLGSPLPAQIRSLLSGTQPSGPVEGTPVFGRPEIEIDDPRLAEAAREAERTPDAQGGYIPVQANQSKELQRGKPVSDVLDPGYTHEYTFYGGSGEELAIGVQFFSPTAQNVSANVAVLDPDDVNAENQCQRDSIMKDDSGVAFICDVNKSGIWKLQLFGRSGESNGIYVVTLERF